ncbi:hypothetical protein pEaSNUABM8_00183 [Erwinia phage pEa_SNUABM_8]|nr:hypothetical protein pEaSNUABM8_00183 [Erwinia phage pEa_SNUABM_8]QVW54935.1 hypothetical protein pEaSNUABM4_00182 [Erwinia phage pEa_SNUABM_4]
MAKTLQEQFIDLVNAKNAGLGLTIDDVDFSDPSPYDGSGEGGNGKNSVLTLTAKATSPNFKGSQNYYFSRFNLTHPNGEDVHSWAVTDLHESWQDDAYALRCFNMNLTNNFPTLSDVVITRWVDPEDPTHLFVKIKLDSRLLKWWGAFTVMVVDIGKQQLMFADGQLDGFN